MIVYKDPNQLIGLRMEAARPALAYEKPRLASIETKVVDEFEKMSEAEFEAWMAERVGGGTSPCHGRSATRPQQPLALQIPHVERIAALAPTPHVKPVKDGLAGARLAIFWG